MLPVIVAWIFQYLQLTNETVSTVSLFFSFELFCHVESLSLVQTAVEDFVYFLISTYSDAKWLFGNVQMYVWISWKLLKCIYVVIFLEWVIKYFYYYSSTILTAKLRNHLPRIVCWIAQRLISLVIMQHVVVPPNRYVFWPLVIRSVWLKLCPSSSTV